MKILREGRFKTQWNEKVTCTGLGNGGGGCGAKLQVSWEDLYFTYGEMFRERLKHVTFMCPSCGVETDLLNCACPTRDLPDKDDWLRCQKKYKSRVACAVKILVVLGGKKVVLIKYTDDFFGKLVLLDVDVEKSESLKDACIREIQKQIGVHAESHQLKFLTATDFPDSNVRERCVSMVYLLELPLSVRSKLSAANEAYKIVIRDLSVLSSDELGFDHVDAITALAK